MKRPSYLAACMTAATTLFVLTACASSPPTRAPGDDNPVERRAEVSTAERSSEDMADSPANNDDGSVQVVLLEAGEEPLKLLRVPAADESSSFSASMSIISDMTLEFGGRELEVALPVMQVESRMTIVPVEDGPDKLVTNLESFAAGGREGVQDAMLALMNAQLEKLNGTVLTASVDERGFVGKPEVELPVGTGDEAIELVESMQSSRNNMSIPLPAEAVGVGARWQVERATKMNGIEGLAIHEVSTVEVLEFVDDAVVVSITSTLTADTPFEREGRGGKGPVQTVTSFTGSGESRLTITPARLNNATGHTTIRFEMTTEIDGQEMPASGVVSVTVSPGE